MIRRRIQSTRLTRTTEKQNRKQTILFTVGTIIIIIALLQLGPIFINNFGNFIYGIRGDEENTENTQEEIFINPPVLTNIPEATQDPYITFKGNSPDSEGVVEIYLNDELADEIKIKNILNFEVNDLQLKSGQNRIKARFIKGNKSSPFSSEQLVSYLKGEPKLEISSPSDNSTFTKADKNILIQGKTDPDNVVTINGFRAIVEASGEFSYQFQLNDGENTLSIEAKNAAGSTTKKELKATYNP